MFMRMDLREKIGVFGGTFNPVHTGHLILAQDALEHFGLDRVLFIPCAHPPHKRADHLAPARHRVAMLRAALRGEPRFQVCTIEIARGGVSYSIDTIRELLRRHPKARFYFVIGADTLNELHTWKSIREVRRLCTFITLDRPGVKVPGGRLTRFFRGHVVGISSSDIRARRARGLAIRQLVPAAVARYIEKKRLYSTKESRRSNR
jgi:nicotinate-nucleotide adenylyltransferase